MKENKISMRKKVLAVALTVALCITGSRIVWAYTVDPDDNSIVYANNGETITDDLSDKTVIVKENASCNFAGKAAEIHGSDLESYTKISGGSIEYGVYGGFSSDSSAVASNTVEITNGTIQGNVMGGMTELGDVCNNTVIISGGEIKGDVIGGRSTGAVYNNTVSIRCDAKLTSVIGGHSTQGKLAGNTLHIAASNT